MKRVGEKRALKSLSHVFCNALTDTTVAGTLGYRGVVVVGTSDSIKWSTLSISGQQCATQTYSIGGLHRSENDSGHKSYIT